MLSRNAQRCRKMLNVRGSAGYEDGSSISDRGSLLRTLGSLLATLLAVAAFNAGDASTQDPHLSIEKPNKSCQAFLLTNPDNLLSVKVSLRATPYCNRCPFRRNPDFWGKRPEMQIPNSSACGHRGIAFRQGESAKRTRDVPVSLAGNLRFCPRRPHSCAISMPRHYSASHW